MSAKDKLKKMTRRLSRKLLNLPEEDKKLDSDTRRILRDVAAKAIYGDRASVKDDIYAVPDKPKPTVPVTVDAINGAGAIHVNFHKTKKITGRFEKPKKYTTNYYTRDGKLLYTSDDGRLVDED